MKKFIGTPLPTKKVSFLGKSNALEIRKLSGLEIHDFQTFVNSEELKALTEGERGTKIQNYILRVGVTDASEITDEEFLTFPLDELANVAKEVLRFSGAGGGDAGPEGPND